MKFREKLDTSDIPYIDSHCHIDFLYKRISYRGSWSKFQMMYADTFMHNYYACVTNFCDPNSFKESKFAYWLYV
jgi:TatD DNase family protein